MCACVCEVRCMHACVSVYEGGRGKCTQYNVQCSPLNSNIQIQYPLNLTFLFSGGRLTISSFQQLRA